MMRSGCGTGDTWTKAQAIRMATASAAGRTANERERRRSGEREDAGADHMMRAKNAAEAERDAILQQARAWATEAKTQRATVNAVGATLGGMADWQDIAGAVSARIEAAEAE